jgi:hypothetical protein
VLPNLRLEDIGYHRIRQHRQPGGLPIANLHYNTVTNQNLSTLHEHYANITLFGDSSSMSTRSLADNIVKALKFAESA